MSSGKTHSKASVFLSTGFVIGFMISGRVDLVYCSIGSLIGVFITPDLDLNKNIVNGSFIKKNVGELFLNIWKRFWKRYALFCKHGGNISHLPVFGTYGRLLYILMMGVLPFYLLYFLILFSLNYHFSLMNELMWWCKIMFGSWYTLGLISSDLIHYALDKLTKNVE